MGDKPKPKITIIPPLYQFLFGGSAGMMAICIVQPMDLLKTRMQLLGPAAKDYTMVRMAKEVVAKEGFKGLYSGISAALFRQATYTTGRLGSFNAITDIYNSSYGTPNFGIKILIGMLAGSVGALVGNPAEVALVRMTADGRLPPEKRRNYSNVFNALGRMIKEEGPGTLLRGAPATVSRAAVVNGAQLASYAQARQMLLPVMGENMLLHFTASMIAGFVTSAASIPLDKVKTIVQNTAKGGEQLGMMAVVLDVLKKEGILGFWSGFLPTYLKIGPHTVFTFIFLEQINAAYFRAVNA
ncbi:mitochondrial 2-oxoglutarate/malate carrier protein-like [Leguminivora glycinivorella]|uniref:mitochondrial 2-oxoglutarate/malate carrier protein-like n=1 Tax=Leguminivora glycinivorella TaxID=1035111 RepID=UPI00200EF03C|nr:mitochondrial 2-oxoglutarate/malate carrier protein-like [Leguminivora glycinivorella]